MPDDAPIWWELFDFVGVAIFCAPFALPYIHRMRHAGKEIEWPTSTRWKVFAWCCVVLGVVVMKLPLMLNNG